MGLLSDNLPPGVTDQQIEALLLEDSVCCDQIAEFWESTKYGPVFKCTICGELLSDEPNED